MREQFLEIYEDLAAGTSTVRQIHTRGTQKGEATNQPPTNNFRVDVIVNSGTPTVDVDVGWWDGTTFTSLGSFTQLTATGSQFLQVTDCPGQGIAAIEVVIAGTTPNVDVNLFRGYTF